MRFDTIIIGGGLSGLTAGIALAEKGQRCAIISTGGSALHFCTGSFDLLGYTGDEIEVKEPLKAISSLPDTHPYAKLGAEKVAAYAEQLKALFAQTGIPFRGDAGKNHYRITPMGELKPTWLTLDEFAMVENPEKLPWKKVSIVNITGFLDFHTQFIANGLEKAGIRCVISNCTIPELERLRESPTEMRSANIARELDKPEVLEKLADALSHHTYDADTLLLPAVFGIKHFNVISRLRKLMNFPVSVIPTLPPAVAGARIHAALCRNFREQGGCYMLGDTVLAGKISNGKLTQVTTVNHGDIALEADHFILATGNVFSQGLTATSDSLYEPVFGLDVKYEKDRSKWFDTNFFQSQPYMEYGVNIDDAFRGKINGEKITNLYVVGSALAGANSLKEASGAGIAMISALHVADEIENRRKNG